MNVEKAAGGWEHRWTESGVLHVVPINDLREHEPSDCWCHPRVEQENGVDIAVHNSMDRREFVTRYH